MFTATNWQYNYDGEKIRTMVIQQLNNKEQAIEILLNAQTGNIEELYCREDAGVTSYETVRNSILKELDAILQKLKKSTIDIIQQAINYRDDSSNKNTAQGR